MIGVGIGFAGNALEECIDFLLGHELFVTHRFARPCLAVDEKRL
jgi:hypothetical protein